MHPRNWKFINFVGHLDNVTRDARCLLERIGAWEKYGATGWGAFRSSSFLDQNMASHATSSRGLKEKFYTSELTQLALEYLQPDYSFEMFNFKKPVLEEG
jgi:hypothetical protein